METFSAHGNFDLKDSWVQGLCKNFLSLRCLTRLPSAQLPVTQQSSAVPAHKEAPNRLSPYSLKLSFLAEKCWISTCSFYSYVPPQLPNLFTLPTLVSISFEACSGELLKNSNNYNKSDCFPQESNEMHKCFLIIGWYWAHSTLLINRLYKWLNSHPKITERKRTTVPEIGVLRQKKCQTKHLIWECKMYQNTRLGFAKIILNCCICCINIKKSCPKRIAFLNILIHRGRETQNQRKNPTHLRSSPRGFYPHELYMSEQCFSDTSLNSASPHPAPKIKPLSPVNWAAKRVARGCSLDWCQPKIHAWKQKSPTAAFTLSREEQSSCEQQKQALPG